MVWLKGTVFLKILAKGFVSAKASSAVKKKLTTSPEGSVDVIWGVTCSARLNWYKPSWVWSSSHVVNGGWSGIM